MSAHDTSVQQIVDEFLAAESLPTSEPHDCPYLPGRVARQEGFLIDQVPSSLYRAFLDRNFRRSGRLIYRPACDGCRACEQIRVPVREFVPSRSQRRILRRNRDLMVTHDSNPMPSLEKWLILQKYLEARHDEQMCRDYATFVEFLYDSPLQTLELGYWLGERLVGVSIADVCPRAFSSVYMYFDPEFSRRSLGSYSILWEIEYCKRRGLEHYYLGYHVATAKTMAYKASFMPHQRLIDAAEWREFHS